MTTPTFSEFDRPRPSPTRTLRADDGVVWTVYVRTVGEVAYLFFDAPHAFRRIAEFPPDWLRLPDDALLRLSWRR